MILQITNPFIYSPIIRDTSYFFSQHETSGIYLQTFPNFLIEDGRVRFLKKKIVSFRSINFFFNIKLDDIKKNKKTPPPKNTPPPL